MFAVIQTGGKQYIVREGQQLSIEKLLGDVGSKVEFDALMLAEDDGSKVELGTPVLSGVKVSGEIVEHGKGEKLVIVKYKAKSRYTRRTGHRQPFTKIMISKIA
ncbi:MAG: 50S ribosomal protein L21 [Candidatus Uhrbacteria bacterium]|nr:50S ribosomal protein L21 [Candidatus Uhrbacteria bacterium]